MVLEDNLMTKKLVEVSEDFTNQFTTQSMLILILIGSNIR